MSAIKLLYDETVSNSTCNQNLQRSNCKLSPAEYGEYDAVAGTRMIASSLSIIGTLSIIILAICKRQAFKSMIHPIFVLSVADLILACLWIVGGSFWLRDVGYRILCIPVSLLTVTFQCITINCTLVYAILAYHELKHIKVTKRGVQTEELTGDKLQRRRLMIVGIYATAWTLPVLLISIMFGSVIGSSIDIVRLAQNCSCWCLPVFGNSLPSARARDQPTANYLINVSKLLASYGCVLSLHYLVVFILLVIIYFKLLKHIKKIRLDYENNNVPHRNDATKSILLHRQSLAKRRIFLFMSVFILNGLINFLLSLGVMVYQVYHICRGPSKDHRDTEEPQNTPWRNTFIIVLLLQSVSVPLQGFFNAIVYGWTSKDFIANIALTKQDFKRPRKARDQQFTGQSASLQNKNDVDTSLLHNGAPQGQGYQTYTESIQGTEIEALTEIETLTETDIDDD